MRISMAVLAYAIVCLTAKKRQKDYPLLFRFIEGYFLAYLCFSYLPIAFAEGKFFQAGICALAGIGLGAVLSGIAQKRNHAVCAYRLLVFFIVVISYYALANMQTALPRLAFALLGGVGLYGANEGLLPEDVALNEMIYSGIGGILGFLFGIFIGFI